MRTLGEAVPVSQIVLPTTLVDRFVVMTTLGTTAFAKACGAGMNTVSMMTARKSEMIDFFFIIGVPSYSITFRTSKR
jgi:hypothetical protein